MDSNDMQQRMQEIQQNNSFADIFGKLVSGKCGYKAVIEKKPEVFKCKSCQTVLYKKYQKFCHECGAKND